MNANYIVKVQDAKGVDVQKALQAAGITVRSVQEVYKEEAEATASPEAAATPAAAPEADKGEGKA